MFITQPRAKKNLFAAPPPPKRKRKADFTIEEIAFDDAARADYLTGFHKRKVQRQKQAQEVAAEKARQEKIAFRKQLKDQRQKAVEDHVNSVNAALRTARLAGGEEAEEEEDDDDEWGGIEDDKAEGAAPVPEFVDHEEEYVDEEKYTTVTVEAVDVDREGMHRLAGGTGSDDDNSDGNEKSDDEENDDADRDDVNSGKKGGGSKESKDNKDRKKVWPKKKKKKFRYENKVERQVSKQKQKQSAKRKR